MHVSIDIDIYMVLALSLQCKYMHILEKQTLVCLYLRKACTFRFRIIKQPFSLYALYR